MRRSSSFLGTLALLAFAGCSSLQNQTGGGTAPNISKQPANATVTVGQTATFTVGATGTSPLRYQWRKNGTSITGAASASYTTPAAQSGDNGEKFDVVASNASGSATSNAASLTVNAATLQSIAVAPASPFIVAGSTQQFTATGTYSDNSAKTQGQSTGVGGSPR